MDKETPSRDRKRDQQLYIRVSKTAVTLRVQEPAVVLTPGTNFPQAASTPKQQRGALVTPDPCHSH